MNYFESIKFVSYVINKSEQELTAEFNLDLSLSTLMLNFLSYTAVEFLYHGFYLKVNSLYYPFDLYDYYNAYMREVPVLEGGSPLASLYLNIWNADNQEEISYLSLD